MNGTSHYPTHQDLNKIYQFLPTRYADEIGSVRQYVKQLDQSAEIRPNSLHRIIQRERSHQPECCPYCGAIHFFLYPYLS